MANVLGELFADIADAIREKTGETGSMKPAEFPSKIDAIETQTDPVLQDKTITENGTYTADSGFDGLGSVTVDVAGSGGGGSLPAGVYWEQQNIKPPNEYKQFWFKLNGNLYCGALGYKGSGNNPSFYKWNGSAWTKLIDAFQYVPNGVPQFDVVELNGKIHFGGGDSVKHQCWDGVSSTITVMNDVPAKVDYRNCFFAHKGKLMCYTCYAADTAGLYEWDEASDTWTLVMSSQRFTYYYWLSVDDVLYCWQNKNLYKFENGTLTQIGTLAGTIVRRFTDGKRFLYTVTSSAGAPQAIYEYDFETNTSKIIGYAPGYSKGGNEFWVADGKIHLTLAGDNGEFATNLIMHEVTE